MVEEKSLKITGANKTFFTNLSKTISKFLIPTKVGINGLLISTKRNSLIKSFERFIEEDYEADEKEIYEKKYEVAYTAYLETLDKYVMDSIYKKVKNNVATDFEKDALSKYYGVIALKENEYVEYKFRKQKYLIELDKENVRISKKDKTIERFNKFFVSKMDWLYKGILKNYSIKIADTMNVYDSSKEWVYIKIFNTLEEYIKEVLLLKVDLGQDEQYKTIKEDFEKYEAFAVGKLDQRDQIEKNMLLLNISRKIFTHSLPLAVAEQCYMKLLKDARALVQDTKIAAKREKAYNLLMNLIEDYNIKLLSTKVYWNDMNDRENFKAFWQKFKKVEELKSSDYIEYIKQKEILFIKDDMTKLKNDTYDYSKLIKYYKRRLVDYNAIREINGVKSEGKYTSKIKVKNIAEKKDLSA